MSVSNEYLYILALSYDITYIYLFDDMHARIHTSICYVLYQDTPEQTKL